MGKNHRHSKKLKSEKNKVHIKSKTKFLPKGQNVTNTSFKIKPIVLQEQLKEREADGLVSRKKANIDELVTKLKHFNDTVKTEACQELKELIAIHPEESIQIYLSSIIQNASALVQDRERKVRRAAVKLIHALFEKFSHNTLRPFFNYILTNLKCSMTNINKHIQEDSLLLLDAILEHRNELIAENFSMFFPNFLMLISKLKNQSTERILSLNLEGKVTSVKWRVKVLARLYGVLNAMTQKRPKSNSNLNVSVSVHAENSVFIPIYKDSRLYETIDCALFAKSTSADSELGSHILNLTQLLHKIWMEIVPESNVKKGFSGTAVLTNEESVAGFTSIVNILRLLQEYVQDSGDELIFLRSKSALFLDSLMSNFPYSHNKKNLQIAKEFPKYFALNCDQSCVEENLTLVYVFITLRIQNAKNSPKQKSIGTYLNSCLNSKFRLSASSFSCLVKILKEIIIKQPFICRKIGMNEADLLESIYSFYRNEMVGEKFKVDILEILMNARPQKSPAWMEKLPNFLSEKRVSAKLINGILNLCRKGDEVVQNAVKRSLKRILANAPKVEICDATDLEAALKDFASIFFYVPNLNSKESEEIRRFNSLHPELTFCKYLQNVLDLRSYLLK